MKTVQSAIQVMACGLFLATTQPALSAEIQPGFYVGLGGGESSFDIEKFELDRAVLQALFSQGLLASARTSTFEDSDTALALFAGYHFNQYIAVEAGYIDLGAAEYRSTGNVNPPGPVVSAPATVDVDVESTGFTLAGLGRLPVGNVVDLHGRLGILFAQTDISVAVRVAPASATDTETLDSIGAFYSVGAGFNFGEHWSLSLDWTRYDNVGDEDEDDDVTTEAGFDIDALSISGMFRF
jgi:OmpA-OmpF porin, OOP family